MPILIIKHLNFMKRTENLFLLALLALTMNSCSTEDTIVSSEKVVETTNYKQEYDILKDYVRIDKINQKYYLDFGQQENQARLASIAPIHKKNFSNELDRLNRYIQEKKGSSSSFVIMQTPYETYYSGFETTDSPTTSTAYKSRSNPIHQLTFNSPNSPQQHTIFTGEDRIRTVVSMFSSERGLKATLTCQTGTSSGQASTVVLTTINHTFQGEINWTHTKAEASVTWDFVCTVDRATISILGNVYNGHGDGSFPTEPTAG